MPDYEQYCPIAKATEVLGERWTLLVIRELLLGSTQFNDIARGVPGMSRSMLSKRLRQLEQIGMLERLDSAYLATEQCEGLRPILLQLGQWSMTWLLQDPTAEECDVELLMWWAHSRLDISVLPKDDRVVLMFHIMDVAEYYWVVVEASGPSVCLADPGFDLDATISTDAVTIHKIWHGLEPVGSAVKDGRMVFEGKSAITRHLARLLSLDPNSGLLGASGSGPRPKLYT